MTQGRCLRAATGVAFTALVAVFAALPARADTFLGVEPEDEAPKTKKAPARAHSDTQADDHADDDSGGSAAVESGSQKKTARRSTRGVGNYPERGDVNFNAALGGSSHTVSGTATVSYSFNRYAAVDTTGTYERYQSGDFTGEQWGPEVALVLRYPTSFIVTPFVGAGPGYVKWQRTYANDLYSDGGSLTGTAFGGLDLRLTQHFGLRVLRRQTTYYTKTPKSFEDVEKDEAKTALVTSIGFHVIL
jgi:hypothetical protein